MVGLLLGEICVTAFFAFIDLTLYMRREEKRETGGGKRKRAREVGGDMGRGWEGRREGERERERERERGRDIDGDVWGTEGGKEREGEGRGKEREIGGGGGRERGEGGRRDDIAITVYMINGGQTSPQNDNNGNKQCHKDHKCDHAHHNSNNSSSR